MKVGTPGFVGASLRKAREARGQSAAALSRLLEVTRASISDYENGKTTPSPELMVKLQQVLNIPPHYFRRIPPQIAKGAIFYRSMSATTKTARLSAERRYEWLQEIVCYLREFINLPVVNFPEFDLPDTPYAIDSETIEDMATEVRRFWKLGDGPISNLVWLLENNGAIVSRTLLDTETLDAFSEFSPDDKTPYIVLGADKNICVRSRFDAAHELAHLILHRRIDKTRISNTKDFALIEKQAHRFAGAFLFPAKSYLAEVFHPSLDTFRVLKATWRVSIQGMISRGHHLGVIADDHAVRLWKNCNRRGWKYKEPLDNELLVEEPRLLRRALQMLLDENIQNRYDILTVLPFSPGDIQELTGLPKDILLDDAPERNNVISIFSRRSS